MEYRQAGMGAVVLWQACKKRHAQLLPAWRLSSRASLRVSCCWSRRRDQLLQLVRLAARLNRVALLPDPECNSTWVGGPRRLLTISLAVCSVAPVHFYAVLQTRFGAAERPHQQP